VLALVTAGGVAYATIPDSNNVYTACIKNAGTIRLIVATRRCRRRTR
jgi:hypothetical protein